MTLTGLIGAAPLATALLLPGSLPERVAMGLFGAISLMSVVAAAVVWFPRARRPDTYVIHDGSAVTLSLRSRRQVPAVLMLVLLVVPDMVRGIMRRPALRLDSTGVQWRGPVQDVEIAWHDVLEVSQTRIDASTPVIRVLGRDGAASYVHTKRGILFRRRLAHPQLDVPAVLVDDPFGMYVILNGLAMARDDERPGRVAAIPELLQDRANGIRPESQSRR
ncbi:hypothetical protein [Nocardioides sp. NPDC006273]|uniref:hypothetical protein n=1 Tax=Nocardioides sp. NPDC006273 TaxID=3155598 RepID=UPI0033B2B1A5